MPANQTPKITLNGKEYRANKPTVGLWRKIIKFNNDFSAKNIAVDEEAYDQMLALLAEGFNNPDVNPDSIEKGLPIDELMPKFLEVTSWIGALVNGKGTELPNGENSAGS